MWKTSRVWDVHEGHGGHCAVSGSDSQYHGTHKWSCINIFTDTFHIETWKKNSKLKCPLRFLLPTSSSTNATKSFGICMVFMYSKRNSSCSLSFAESQPDCLTSFAWREKKWTCTSGGTLLRARYPKKHAFGFFRKCRLTWEHSKWESYVWFRAWPKHYQAMNHWKVRWLQMTNFHEVNVHHSCRR